MKNLPPRLTEKAFNSFVFQTWHRSAYMAYKGYLQCGRGLVVWDWNFVELTMAGYITKAQIECHNFDAHCVAMVERYDPKETLVVGIRWRVAEDLYSTAFFLLKVESLPSPFEIYSQVQN